MIRPTLNVAFIEFEFTEQIVFCTNCGYKCYVNFNDDLNMWFINVNRT